MKKWIFKNIINIGLIIIFVIVLALLILSAFGRIILPSYGFVALPFILVGVIILANGDFSFKIGDLFEIKKEVSSIKKELGILNTKISNINTNQNITVLSVNPADIKEILEKEILDKIKSQSISKGPNIIISSPSTEVQNGDSHAK